MNFDVWTIVGAVVIIAAVVIAIVIKIVKAKQDGEDVNFKKFIDKFGDQIVALMADVVNVLQVNQESFETKEDYEKAIIQLTVEKLEENWKEMGIECYIFDIMDVETITQLIWNIYSANLLKVFAGSSMQKITSKPDIYDTTVVAMAEDALNS